MRRSAQARLALCSLVMLASTGCAVVSLLDGAALNGVNKKQADFDELPDSTKRLHGQLLVADLHADTLMLDRGGVRGIQKRHGYGHADAPRLREGGVGFQALTVATVTPVIYSPRLNSGVPLPNAQWLLSPLQGWPARTWFNSREHALHQAHKWRVNTSGADAPFTPILCRADLAGFLASHYHQNGANWVPKLSQRGPIATVLGLEGAHAIQLRDSDTDAAIAKRVQQFREAGFRMVALTHRFDNALCGASEGAKRCGVTALGHRLLKELQKQRFICDLAHTSEAGIQDILDHYPTLPVVVSHGGIAFEPLNGKQEASRLLSVESARRIAQRGGIIGIGLWPEALGDAEPSSAALMIKRCIADPKIGRKHVALGSDMDGAVKAAFAANHYALLTHELVGLAPDALSDVMGGNVIRFYLRNLPEG